MKSTLVISATCLLLGFAGGWVLRGDHEDATRLHQVTQAVQKTEVVRDLVTDLGNQQAAVQANQAVKDRIITREVTRYVQVTPALDRCTLPGTWRVRHDAAARGEPATTGELAADSSEPVDDAAALDTVAENYAAGRHYADQLNGWIDYWERVGTLKVQCR